MPTEREHLLAGHLPPVMLRLPDKRAEPEAREAPEAVELVP